MSIDNSFGQITVNTYNKITCNKCFKLKPKTEFYVDKIKKSGYKNQCKECIKKANTNIPEYTVEFADDIDSIKLIAGMSLIRPTKVVALPDIHYPFNINMKCIDDFLADYQPDVIIWLGDTLDFDYLSKYTKENKLVTADKLKPDCDTVSIMLDYYMTISKASKAYYLEGNHEFRMVKHLEKEPAGIGSLEVYNLLKLKEKGIIWSPMNKLVQVGKLYFTHGTYFSKFHADKHVANYGRNIVYGHTHTIQSYSGMRPYDVKVPHIAQSIGCLCTINPTYMRNNPNRWVNAFYIAEIEEDGTFYDSVVKIIDGGFRIPGTNVKYASSWRRSK